MYVAQFDVKVIYQGLKQSEVYILQLYRLRVSYFLLRILGVRLCVGVAILKYVC